MQPTRPAPLGFPISCAALIALVASALGTTAAPTSPAAWQPAGLPPPPASGPALCPRDFLTQPQGRAVLDAALTRFPDRAAWQAYAEHVRPRIQSAANLSPWPRRTPLNPIMHSRREHDDYSVENVAFESVPGSFVTGNLYRPLNRRGEKISAASLPVILCTHGHTGKIEKPSDYDRHGRFHPFMQARCAGLARMGAIVFSIDMFGCGDSIAILGPDAHRQPFAMTIQLWNATRALDFLLSLDGADPKRVAVTGESGGATQALLLTALDPRVAVSVPVVMVSAHFFGGCPCESGLPIHRGADHFVSNAMIAALAAPRPQLVISDGKDWTLNTPAVEYPFLQAIYGRYGAEKNAANVHLPLEGHDYGPSKRAAAFRFLAAQLGLDLGALENNAGAIDESRLAIEPAAAMRAFDDAHPIPAKALRTTAEIERTLHALQR